jgi:hypothetical protein
LLKGVFSACPIADGADAWAFRAASAAAHLIITGLSNAARYARRIWTVGAQSMTSHYGIAKWAIVLSASVSPFAAHAFDLGRMLHGAPAQAPKAAPPAQMAQVGRAPGVAADEAVEAFLRALAVALKARDGQPMRSLLSDHYTVTDTTPGEKSAELFVIAVERIASPEQMVLQQVMQQDGQRIERVELRFSNERDSSKTFRFDAAGKLLASDLFVARRHVV